MLTLLLHFIAGFMITISGGVRIVSTVIVIDTCLAFVCI